MTSHQLSARHRQEIRIAVQHMKTLDHGELIDLAHEYAQIRNRLRGDELRFVYQRLHDEALNEMETRLTA